MNISFSFTTKLLIDTSNTKTYLDLLNKSIKFAKRYHRVKLYTDDVTLPIVSNIDVDIVLVDTTGFRFIDDFKVYLLSHISDDEVLVDVDLFLYKPLYLKDGWDIWVDFKDNSSNEWYKDYIKYCTDNGIVTILPDFIQSSMSIPNIGILKIGNPTLKKDYIKLYNKVRYWLFTLDDTPDIGLSIILGQYLLGLLLKDGKYKIFYCYGNGNDYIHLSGPVKFKEGILNSIEYNKKLI
jgi:hypothetical protein